MIRGHAVSRNLTPSWKYTNDQLMIEQIVVCKFEGASGHYIRENVWWVKLEEILIIFSLNDII